MKGVSLSGEASSPSMPGTTRYTVDTGKGVIRRGILLRYARHYEVYLASVDTGKDVSRRGILLLYARHPIPYNFNWLVAYILLSYT